MSKIIYKFFAGWDYEKEENWLNMMSAKGKQLISVGICRYEFEDGEPNKYTYRYELLKNPSDHPESLEYIRFVEETGAEHIGSVEGWAYFRKETSAGEFNLFSDPSSIASYNMRMLRMVLGVGATQVILAFVLSALIAWIMGGWFFVSTFLAAIFLGFAVLCAFGAFRIKMKLSRLKNDFGVQAGMADFYGQTSVFTFGAGAKRVVVSIIGMLVWLYLYIFLHEAGHALVAIMYGNTIESFVVFGRWPHVSLGLPYYFTDFGLGLFLAGGVILPMLCGAVAIAFYRPGVRHFWYHEFIYRTADILPFITLIVWAGFPIMSLFATPPPWEDVTRFINVTGIHPLVVAACTVAIVAVYKLLARKKKISEKWSELRGNQKESRALNTLGSFGMAAFVIVFGFIFAPSSSFGGDHVFHMNATWGDIRMEARHWEFPIELEESRMYSVDLRTTGNGFLAAVSFISPYGSRTFWEVGENISHSFGLGLAEGITTLEVVILMNEYDFAQFLSDIGEENRIPEIIANVRDVFDYSGDDYSFNLFVKIN